MILALCSHRRLLFLFLARGCGGTRRIEALILVATWLKRRLALITDLKAREVACFAPSPWLLHGDTPALSSLHHARL